MDYFITNLSLSLLVKEFLKLENIWRSYRQNGWLCYGPHSSYTVILKESGLTNWNNLWLTVRTVTSCCYVNKQINLSLILRYKTATDQFWVTKWQTDVISVWPTADHTAWFCYDIFLLCCSNSVQWVVISYMTVCFIYSLSMAIFERIYFTRSCVRAYSKHVPRTNCALRIKKCAPRISGGVYFLSTS